MAKPRTIYVCQSCGHEHHKWGGKCKGCDEWNTLVEEIRGGDNDKPSGGSAKAGYGAEGGAEPVRMSEVEFTDENRVHSGISEFDRVLGGGFVPGSVVLLGGDPGIGKSTLSLQVAGHFAERELDVLYVSGEESLSQLRMRAERLTIDADNVWVVGETILERAEKRLRDKKPDLFVVDSIQTLSTERLTSSPGSVAQLREVTSALTQLAKGLNIPTVLIGHVTKEGAIAGPKVLEHMVDTVLYFEGQPGMNYRVLRAVKNRYGSTNEIGVFEMRGSGLHEVLNPSAMFLAERPEKASGSAVVPIVEGTRPLLVEIQALVSPSNYGPPRITSIGVDQNRVMLLLNIIEKRTGLKVAGHDVFVNVAGGARVSEPAADLGIAVAILSSYLDRGVPSNTVAFGEVGLTGEVRAVTQALARLGEAKKLGFERGVLPRGNVSEIEEVSTPDNTPFAGFKLDFARTLADVIRAVFGKDVLS
ncbi:DNA repair protein RadA [Persicimonas caeni]|uniref:DNA repair protein RadA n=1 Tax=Persicimonas caeni TaxID=2292766 RepID=A0A4Y6PNL1_PERCE|nr:DNA repair protein RadA [Persicimonas caeni]QDG49874.1 DNA repair protein RadA [Persicimonas caeni]QED31095.1 DNA repair protein RadA [Persicimonas caeni]